MKDINSLNIKKAKEVLKSLSNDDLIHIANSDYKKGIVEASKKLLKNREKEQLEYERVKVLYDFQEKIAGKPGTTFVGVDEVGRGPLAGPLTVAAVSLNEIILGLNDSKKLSAKKREELALEIKAKADAYSIFSVPPVYIDKYGMTTCLRRAFTRVVEDIETKMRVDVILLDGNPMHIDSREVNVIKGDAKCASISAASIIAKVHRDNYMVSISEKYKNYQFDKNKGYGTKDHIEAIKQFGLTNVHRKSFCTSFMQETLF